MKKYTYRQVAKIMESSHHPTPYSTVAIIMKKHGKDPGDYEEWSEYAPSWLVSLYIENTHTVKIEEIV